MRNQDEKKSARYVKIVEWSDEDQCFVGSCPGLVYGGCHGDDEKEVFAELCAVAEETIELFKEDGKPLPPATSGKDYANKMSKVVQQAVGKPSIRTIIDIEVVEAMAKFNFIRMAKIEAA